MILRYVVNIQSNTKHFINYNYHFSGEGEILQISRHGGNNGHFQQPALPVSASLVSQEFSQTDGKSITSVRPHFSSKGTIYRVKIGSSVTMACEIINLGNYVCKTKGITCLLFKQIHYC